MSGTETPMLKQYKEIKAMNEDKILFFRVGDFYEMFYDDAKTAAKELEITLTARETGKDNPVPLAGFPYHAANSYIFRLIEKGYKVAICEQMEDPKTVKGLVKREVVRVITPGTLVEQTLLTEKDNNYLLSLAFIQDRWGLAFIDVSTGEFMAMEVEGDSAQEKALDEFSRIAPAECLVAETLKNDGPFSRIKGGTLVNYLPKSHFNIGRNEKVLKNFFKVYSLESLGLEDFPAVTCAAGALVTYLKETSGDVRHISKITLYHPEEYMVIDSISRRNLELTFTIKDRKKYGSLLWVLDKTQTAMGGRLLKKWVQQPLVSKEKILKRQAGVEELLNNSQLQRVLAHHIREVYDLERLISRINMGTSNPRDVVALKKTLLLLPALKEALARSKSLKALGERIVPQEELTDLIERAITPNPPVSLKEGGIIREGFNPPLDELRTISRNSKEWIAAFQEQERQRTGIKSLKVRYNKVFGYYIEITNANLSMAPDNYIRKQTLVNAERFISEPLKEKEEIILRAQESITELEYNLFQEIRQAAAQVTKPILATAASLAELDCLLSFAAVSRENRYHKPQINEGDEISIQGGRHPVVEKVLPEKLFVENDVLLNPDNRLLLLTGPNMAGKSTYLRQSALLVLMAQMGCFIPARSAQIGLVDRIFTRVGAADDLVGGQSTFMVEMNEVGNILKNATEKSLILLDEVGRGTSTYDGVSIALATAEYIHDQVQAKTLFATHYHELVTLEDRLPGIKNFNIAVKERGDEIVFLRKVIPGGTSRSYGIQVAHLAGLPASLIARAKQALKSLEKKRLDTSDAAKEVASAVNEPRQLSLFLDNQELLALEKKLLDVDLLTTTPLEVMQTVYELQLELKKRRVERNGTDGDN